MGTLPFVENLIVRCADGGVVRIEALTTTDDLSDRDGGSVEVYGELSDGEAFALHVGLGKFSDSWLERFCDALAANPAFRAALPGLRDADGLVVPAAPARDGGGIGVLARKGKGARFKDYVGLRSGRDRYSAMRLPDLEAEAGEKASRDIEARTEGWPEAGRPAERAKALRWFLRGLPAGMAVRKVEVDREVSVNASGRGRR